MLGIAAEKSGRNDLSVEGRKFSAMPFMPGKDAATSRDPAPACGYAGLKPLSNVSEEKLRSKGVESCVAGCQPGGLLPGSDCELMKEKLIAAFGEVYGTAPEKIGKRCWTGKTRSLRTQFSSWEWNYGPDSFTFEAERRFAWGDIQIQLQVDRGRVEQAVVYSDAMEADWFSQIRLEGCLFSSRALCRRIEGRRQEGNPEINTIIDDICQFLQEQDV